MTIGEFIACALYGGCIASSEPGEPMIGEGARPPVEAFVVWFWMTFYAYRPARAGLA